MRCESQGGFLPMRLWLARVAIIGGLVLAAMATWLPARANEVTMDCGYATLGYGGTYINATAYSTSFDCAIKYLAGTRYQGGIPYSYGQGYTGYDQHVEIEGQSAASSHRLCTSGFTICSVWKGTSS